MAGELVIQVIDIGRFRAIRPVLDELDAARALGLETLAVLREVATSPLVRQDRHRGLAAVRRILNHPELQLRVFLTPATADGMFEGLVRALCFENGAQFSLVTSVGPSWVVLDIELAVFGTSTGSALSFSTPTPRLAGSHIRVRATCAMGSAVGRTSHVWPRGSAPFWTIPSPPRSPPD
jgi:hypothetical protein